MTVAFVQVSSESIAAWMRTIKAMAVNLTSATKREISHSRRIALRGVRGARMDRFAASFFLFSGDGLIVGCRFVELACDIR
jgi:hypothetical protein